MISINGVYARPGAEANFTQRYLDEEYINIVCKDDIAIFIEPNLGFSKPDLVIVFWDSQKSINWPLARTRLKKVDFKLIQFLYRKGSATDEEIYKIFPNLERKSILRLVNAKLIEQWSTQWILSPIDSIFSIKRIISIEAKLSFSKRAIYQAYTNSIFSTESHVLTKSKSPGEELQNDAIKKGIGVISYEPGKRKKRLVSSKKMNQPISHISWIFNNSIWEQKLGEDMCTSTLIL